uniref:MULE transposase domain-containing protein n=1 Tax=Ditylenchus dipsaci TaxID=166011 RepID=A0A915DBI7_9BILA
MDFDFIANVLARIDQNQQVVAQNDDIIPMVKSSKGNDMAIHHGFRFMKHQKNEDETKQYWKCDKAYGGNGAKCKARLHTLVASNLFLKFIPHDSIYPHNHEIDPMAVTVSKIKANIKQRSVETREKPQQLLNHELQSAPIAVASSLSKSAVRKQVRRIRIRNQIPVVEARRVEDVQIPAASQGFRAQIADPERVLLFGRERNINWSAEMKIVYMDGTFSITPHPFAQVYVVLAERSARVENGGKWVFPVLYALLKNKSRPTYVKLFKMIREVWPQFRPASFSVDFELAAIQALQEVFPQSIIAGCFYHLMRNFKKCLSNNNLVVRYRDPEFSIQARMIMSLAFVPPLDVWNCFAQLEAYLPAELSPVMHYFSQYYVGTLMDPPMFPVNLWSCYDRTLEGCSGSGTSHRRSTSGRFEEDSAHT